MHNPRDTYSFLEKVGKGYETFLVIVKCINTIVGDLPVSSGLSTKLTKYLLLPTSSFSSPLFCLLCLLQAIFHISKGIVAVKVLSQKFEKRNARMCHEVSMLMTCNHPNIIKNIQNYLYNEEIYVSKRGRVVDRC